ncbi:sigma-70 family RNA polymerase sigma factor [Salinispira pacifica]
MNVITTDLYSEIHRFIARRVRNPADADDICQELFERIVPKLAAIPAERLRAYCFSAARRALADHYRGRTREPTVPLSDRTEGSVADAPVGRAAGPAASAEEETNSMRARILSWIPEEIEGLPDTYREPLRLFELEKRSVREVAQQLHLSLSAVKVRLHRGRAALAERIAACCRLFRDSTGRVIDYEKRSAEEGCTCSREPAHELAGGVSSDSAPACCA